MSILCLRVATKISKDEKDELVRKIVTDLRKIYRPTITAACVTYIIDYGSPLYAVIKMLVQKYGKIYVPLKLTKYYNLTETVVSKMKKYDVKFIDDPDIEKQYSLLDKGFFKKIRFDKKEVCVEKIPIKALRMKALTTILKAVVPRRYNYFDRNEQEILPYLVQLGYIEKRNGHYTARRDAYFKAYEEVLNRWYRFKILVLNYIHDLGIIVNRCTSDYKYVTNKTITQEDLIRLYTVYSYFEKLPVKIISEEDKALEDILKELINEPYIIVKPCI